MYAFIAFLNGFSVFLFVLSIIFVLFSKRLIKKEISKVERKKKEIQSILDSADQMIEELNNFSDYVMTNLEEKALKIGQLINNLDEKIKESKEYIDKEIGIFADSNDPSLTTDQINGKSVIPFQARTNPTIKMVSFSKNEGKSGIKGSNTIDKHSQILMLYENGIDEAEIAKKLNVGRGEIRLVLGIRKGIM